MIIKPVHSFLIILLIMVCGITSCVSANLDYTLVDAEIYIGDYNSALKTVNEKSNYYYNSNDKVLIYLDSGILQHFAGDYENSNDNLQKAEIEIEKNFTKSISQSIGQFIINDSVADYAGETYEDIYTNIFKCLNYIHLGQIEDAMVEIRRFDNKMKVVGHEYQAVIDSQKKKMNSSEEIAAMRIVNSDVKFHNSALARYLSMILYRASGDYDSARIDLDKIKDAYRFQPELYNFAMPSDLENELEISSDMARVNVICFTGKGPVKIEEVSRLPFRSTYYKLAIPVLERRPTNIRSIQIIFKSHDSEQNYKLNLHAIESIENIASETYKQHFAVIYARAVARSIGKAVQTGIYNDVADNAEDSNIRGIFSLLDFASRITTEVTETADTRISRYFPGYASVGGITIPPGTYSVSICFYDSNKNAVQASMIPDYEVKAGELNLIERTLQR